MAAFPSINSRIDGKALPVLPFSVQIHLGELLGMTYSVLPDVFTDCPGRLSALVGDLTAALFVKAVSDDQTFSTEFLAMRSSLRRFAQSLTRDPARADDLVQDTMLKAWRSRESYAIGTNISAWLFTIMRNSFYSNMRQSGREISTDSHDHVFDQAALPQQLDSLDIKDMETALSKLTVVMRQALMLVAIEHASYEEAAVIMKCRIGTVKSRVWRARQQLTINLGYTAFELGADNVTQSAMHPARVPARY